MSKRRAFPEKDPSLPYAGGDQPVPYGLFVYGRMLSGEPDHPLLEGAEKLGDVSTAPGYTLVEVGAMAGMFEERIKQPEQQVHGELYRVVYDTMAACDKHNGHPHLYHRAEIQLSDGSRAFAYLFRSEQVRGRRRLRHGDWRQRFAVQAEREVGPFVRWARARHRK